MKDTDFIKHFIANAPQLMWFLGAGISRTAGMPTASDIIWDLKIKYYCLQENQEIKNHDRNNEIIRKRVQRYLDAKNFPPLGSNEEYSFYFNLIFGNDYTAQRKFLAEQLANHKLSLNKGHKVLAALTGMQKSRLIFTTNFDEVIEQAYAKIVGRNLQTFHLEGSYAALTALNNEQFPIYAKVHGDFKYESIKNLSPDLKENDEKIQACLLAASSRFGLIISGYSGRDENVMSMFDKALAVHNAFPFGIFWTTPSIKDVSPTVSSFIVKAKAKGINAHIVETGTFDTMLSKIWRQMPDKPSQIADKISSTDTNRTSIPLPAVGTGFPILRTNAIPILEVPDKCAQIQLKQDLSYSEIKDRLRSNRPHAIITRTERVLGWGDESELSKGLGSEMIETIRQVEINDPFKLISERTYYKAFYERALVTAICNDKPLLLKNDKGFYLTIDPNQSNDIRLQPLKDALKDYYGNSIPITGRVSNVVLWSEAIELSLVEKNEKLWLVITPTIWIEPSLERKNNIEFIKRKKVRRYNQVMNNLLNAWIKILLNVQDLGKPIEIECYQGSTFPAKFKISTRTSFSRK